MMTSEQRAALIRDRLTTSFQPHKLDIIDDGDKHIGHASAKGGGHFAVVIVSDAFQGKKTLERHRMVYSVLRDALQGEIHALEIKAYAPNET